MISKINGWITVDPKTMSSKDAFEKCKIGNVKKPSLMAPVWMQQEAKRDEERLNLFKVVSTNGSNMRIEKNRVVLSDKEDLPKSIFNSGSIRHNFNDVPADVYRTVRNMTCEPVRLL
jgi:hypothetical protein